MTCRTVGFRTEDAWLVRRVAGRAPPYAGSHVEMHATGRTTTSSGVQR